MNGAHVVERAAIPFDVLDHEMVFAAHQVLGADLLAGLQLAAEYVFDSLASLGLRSEVDRGVGGHLLACIRPIKNLPTPPPVLAVDTLARLDIQEPRMSHDGRQVVG
jgi:hypothetical protein